MNSKILIFTFLAIFLLASVSATVTESNQIFESLVTENGNTAVTNTPIDDVSVFGLVCEDNTCSQINQSQQFFNGQVLNTGNDNEITIFYPTNLLSEDGYGVYFFKEGYIPYEVRSNWAGSGAAGSFNRYLAKKEVCSAEIAEVNIPDFIEENKASEISVEVNAPVKQAGLIEHVPEILKEHYRTETSVFLEITNLDTGKVFKESIVLDIEFSDTRSAAFSWTPDKSGNYDILAFTEVTDPSCLTSQTEALEQLGVQVKEEGIDTEAPEIINILPFVQIKVKNGVEERSVLVDFDSNEYPIIVEFFLLDEFGGEADRTDPVQVDSQDSVPLTYILPGNLEFGEYEFFMQVSDLSGNTVVKKVGDLTHEENEFGIDLPEKDTEAPEITNPSLNPDFSLENPLQIIEGTSETIEISFESNEFPIEVKVILKDQLGNEVDEKIININSNEELPLEYTIPADLASGLYILEIKVSDLSGNTGTLVLGAISIQPENQEEFVGILSPVNITYDASEILIKLVSSGTQITYSIDSSSPETYTSEFTMNFSEGQHRIDAFTITSTGETLSETVFFSVSNSSGGDDNTGDHDDNTNNNNNNGNTDRRITSYLSGTGSNTGHTGSITNLDYQEDSEEITIILSGSEKKDNWSPVNWIILLVLALIILITLILIVLIYKEL